MARLSTPKQACMFLTQKKRPARRRSDRRPPFQQAIRVEQLRGSMSESCSLRGVAAQPHLSLGTSLLEPPSPSTRAGVMQCGLHVHVPERPGLITAAGDDPYPIGGPCVMRKYLPSRCGGPVPRASMAALNARIVHQGGSVQCPEHRPDWPQRRMAMRQALLDRQCHIQHHIARLDNAVRWRLPKPDAPSAQAPL